MPSLPKTDFSLPTNPKARRFVLFRTTTTAGFCRNGFPDKFNPEISSTKTLGQHLGFACYTVGQRKGLGIALGRPMFVTSVDPLNNQVTLGPEAEIWAKGLIARDINWLAGDPPTESDEILAKIRYTAKETPARIQSLPDSRLEVRFESPQRAITPGQSVVFFRKNELLGGGIIESSLQ